MHDCITPQNLWEKMLKYKHLLKYEYGFTIPFLVGAYYRRGFLSDEDLQSSYCIRFVLDAILESISENNLTKIIDCPDLSNELVFQYLSTGLTTSEVEEKKGEYCHIDHKIYWDRNEVDTSNLDLYVEYLWDKLSKREPFKYSELVQERRFSCYKGAWRDYVPNEKKFIDNIENLGSIDNIDNL